ncbi:hypothetical protein ACKS0A_02538 [Histoplasma ohiense]
MAVTLGSQMGERCLNFNFNFGIVVDGGVCCELAGDDVKESFGTFRVSLWLSGAGAPSSRFLFSVPLGAGAAAPPFAGRAVRKRPPLKNRSLPCPRFSNFQYRGYLRTTIILSMGWYKTLQMSTKSLNSAKPTMGELHAAHSASFNAVLPSTSRFSASRAPGTVCLRARLAWRTSVDDSCSMIRPLVGSSCFSTLRSPKAMGASPRPNEICRLCRIQGDGSADIT